MHGAQTRDANLDCKNTMRDDSLNRVGNEVIVSVVLGSMDLRPSEASRFG